MKCYTPIEFEFGQHRMHFGQVDAALYFAPPPDWIAACSAGLCPVLEPLEWNVGPTRQLTPVTDGFLSKITADAQLLAEVQERGSVVELLADVLRLYAQTRDESANHRVLLGYWQIAENVVYPVEGKRSGETKHVARRLASVQSFSSTDLSGIEDVLVEIGMRRNEIVHRGRHAVARLDDLDVLKICAECAIHFVRYASSYLQSRAAMEEFFAIRFRKATELAVTRQALALVRRLGRGHPILKTGQVLKTGQSRSGSRPT